RGEFGAYAIGAADHRFVTLAHRAGELVRSEGRQDGERDLAADALDAGQHAERVALGRRAEAEQGPGVLAHLQLGEDQHLAADWADRIERAAAAVNLITDAADVDHRAVGREFGEDSGKARDHPVISAREFTL